MKVLFIHQNFPGQFVHLAPALATLGHEVVALTSRLAAPKLPGVHCLTYSPQSIRSSIENGNISQSKDTTRNGGSFTMPFVPSHASPILAMADNFEAKLARADSAAKAMEKMKAGGFVPDLVIAHSGWGEALFVKAVFPSTRLLIYAEYFYGADGGDFGFDPEFSRQSVYSRQKSAVNNLHLMQALVGCDAAVSPTLFQKFQHPPELQSKISVIHDGVDTQRFVPNPNSWVSLANAGVKLTGGDEIITFVARQLEPYRGYHTFMRALPELLSRRPNARVVIVGGDGVSYGASPQPGHTWKQIFLDEVKAEIDVSRVHFVGKVPHEILTQLLQISSVHVYLTYPFVLSWSLLEAMSMGCLVVASDTAPVREVIEDGRNGLLTDFFDAQALAQRVDDALTHRRTLANCRLQARETVVQRFDLRSVCLPRLVSWALDGAS
jgi:glycosyltransferase involved in cell wall biosynthesis